MTTFINPKTNKKIKKDGKTYNDLIKEGYEVENNKLVKRDIKYVKDIVGNIIPINGPDYRRLIDIGYIWDPVTSSMIFNHIIKPIEVQNNQIPEEIYKNISYRKLVLEYIAEGQKEIKEYKVKHVDNEKKFIKEWWYAYPLIEEVLSLTAYPEIREGIYFGPAYMGSTNCVLEAIYNHMTSNNYEIPKLLDEFIERKGIFQDDYEELSRICGMKIKIITDNDEFIYGQKRNKRPELKLYYRNNHVEPRIIKFEDKKNIFVDEPNELLKELDLTTIKNVIGSKNYMYAVETDDIIYRRKFDDGINLEEENVYSATRYYTNEFIQNNQNISPIVAYHDNIRALETIYSHGFHWSKDYKEATVVVDLINAYGSYDKFTSYSGFPNDMGQCISNKVGEESLLDIINTAEGFGLVTMKCMFTDNEVTRWISFPYIKYRWSLGHDLTIHYLLFGNRVHLNTNMFKHKDKRIWHKVIGNLIRTEKDVSFVTTDPVLATSIYGSEIYPNLFYCSNKVHSIGISYYPHIVGYIHNYIEIEMERKYLQLKNLGIEVFKILVDGLSIRMADQNKLPRDPLFKLKIEGYTEMQSMEPHYDPVEPIKYSNEYCRYLTIPVSNNTDYVSNTTNYVSNKYCLIGRPGTGKSYSIRQLYMQCNNTVILVPTNDLMVNYPGFKVYTIHMYIERKLHKDETVFIDEYTMVSQELLNQIQTKKVVLAGDDAQLKSVKGTPIDIRAFNIVELTKIYRQKCPQFQKQLEHTRQTGDISWITKTVSPLKAVQDRFVILCSTHEQIDKINKIGLNSNPNNYIGGLKIDSPIRFYKTTKDYNAGEFGNIIKIENGNMTIKMDRDSREVECPVSLFNKESRIIKLSHAITYHAVQGRTIDGHIALSELNLFDGKRMKYVGVSRATTAEQLHILEEC